MSTQPPRLSITTLAGLLIATGMMISIGGCAGAGPKDPSSPWKMPWTKKDKPPMVRLDLHVSDYKGGDGEVIAHFICPFHGGYATQKAKEWITKYLPTYRHEPTDTDMETCHAIAKEINRVFSPERIKVKLEGKFWRILEIELSNQPIERNEEPDDDIPF